MEGQVKKENTAIRETAGHRDHLNHMGRDEMNMVEFPLAALADRVPQGCKTLVFEYSTWDRSQKRHVTRRLTISASDKYGLPTALDDEVILGLVQLSKAEDFAHRQVPFSRYRLLGLLGWRDESKSYARLGESLKRWLGVTLYYENAWWDNVRKRWIDANFHLLDNVTLYHRGQGSEAPSKASDNQSFSTFTWNDTIYRSFRAGNLKSIDLELYRKLKSTIAKRIYRFLDKRFYRQTVMEFALDQFARVHIGLSRNYDTAQLKRRLSPAIRELENAGYLKPLPVEKQFVRVRRGEWKIVFVRAEQSVSRKTESYRPVGLEARLISRGVTAFMAARLVREYSAELIEAKLQVFDQLVCQKAAGISKNPAGYLVQSIRKDYTPPFGRQGKCASSTTPKAKSIAFFDCRTAAGKKHMEDNEFYVEQEKIRKHLAGLSADGLTELESEALKSSPSFLVQSFRRAVESGSEKLAREYRRCLLEGHLRTVLGLGESSHGSKT
jgi:hypothetical protein